MSAVFRYTVESGPGDVRADNFLTKASGKSRAFIQEQIKLGRVLLNDLPLKKSGHKLKVGAVLSGEWGDEPVHDLTPIAGDLDIIHEDAHLLVINKRQGVVVHPAPGHRDNTLVHHLLHHLKHQPNFISEFMTTAPTRPGVVHRLDRGTSGLILVAKSRAIQEALQKQFRLRQVEKEYEACVWGVIRECGKFMSPIGRDPRDRKRMSSRSPQAKQAHTAFTRLSHTAHFSHVALFPKTGRTHQLRVHLVENKTPVVGDDLYGTGTLGRREHMVSPELLVILGQINQTLLHARKLTFTHPISEERLSLSAPRPIVFERFLAQILEHDK